MVNNDTEKILYETKIIDTRLSDESKKYLLETGIDTVLKLMNFDVVQLKQLGMSDMHIEEVVDFMLWVNSFRHNYVSDFSSNDGFNKIYEVDENRNFSDNCINLILKNNEINNDLTNYNLLLNEIDSLFDDIIDDELDDELDKENNESNQYFIKENDNNIQKTACDNLNIVDVDNKNILFTKGTKKIKQLLNFETENLFKERDINKKSIDENINFKQSSKQDPVSKVNPYDNFELWCELHKDEVIEFFKEKCNKNLDELELSARCVNCLKISGFNYLSELIFLNEKGLGKLIGFDNPNIQETIHTCKFYLLKNKNLIINSINNQYNVENEHAQLIVDDLSENQMVNNDLVDDDCNEILNYNDNLNDDIINVELDNEQDKESCESNQNYIQENDNDIQETACNNLNIDNLNIIDMDLSVRSKNALIKAGIETVGQLKNYRNEYLYSLRNIGKKSLDEIIDFKQSVTQNIELKVNPYDNFGLWCELHKDEVIECFKNCCDILIDNAEFSAGTINRLKLNGFKYLSEIIFLKEFDLKELNVFKNLSIQEIIKTCKFYLRENKDLIINSIIVQNNTKNEYAGTTIDYMSVNQIINSEEYGDAAKKYIMHNNIPIENMNFSNRALNSLTERNITTLYDIAVTSNIDIFGIRGIGRKTAEEIVEKKNSILENMKQEMLCYCKGDLNSLFSVDFIKDKIQKMFKVLGFKGISYHRIKEKLPEEIDEKMIKKAIGQLIRDGELEYVDYRLFKKYPSVYEAIDNYFDKDYNRNLAIVKERFSGKSLEEIANLPNINLTRERVRQIITKTMKQIKGRYIEETGFSYFDEDYYQYLYENYLVDKVVYIEWLKVSENTYFYLYNTYSSGKKAIEEAVKDENIDVAIRLKLIDYLNRNKILINGKLINKKRSDIEDYVLSEYCKDEIHLDDFVFMYNNLLLKNNIDYDESIYYNDSVMRTRSNRLASSNNVLWKQGMMLRYYDINSNDYDELIDTIGLKNYKNTEVSTLKFIEDFPDLMKKYDIRDQYELHNLLKKIIDPKDYNDIDFNRQPVIKFGEFDREKVIFEIISTYSPITSHDLIAYIHSEFGYDDQTIQANALTSFTNYYHRGVYSVDYKKIPDDRLGILKKYLNDDFYFIEDIKNIYKELYSDADEEEINPYTLKQLGFNVYSRYVLQNHPSLETYFTNLLTCDDIIDITSIKKRFGYIVSFTDTLSSLKKNYEIFEFEPNQIINYRKINKLGITKEKIKQYALDVYDFVDDGYFTLYSIRNMGFISKLDDLGFNDYFYNYLLFLSDDFSSCRALNNFIFYKGSNINEIKKSSFINNVLDEYDDVNVDDVIDYIKDEYGIVTDRLDIIDASKKYGKYYDSIMDKVYRNESYYYAEFDD